MPFTCFASFLFTEEAACTEAAGADRRSANANANMISLLYVFLLFFFILSTLPFTHKYTLRFLFRAHIDFFSVRGLVSIYSKVLVSQDTVFPRPVTAVIVS